MKMRFDRIFVIGFPKSGTTTINTALESSGFIGAHWYVEEGFVGDLMYRGFIKHDDPWYYLQNYSAITQADVCLSNKNMNYWPNLDFSIIKKIQTKYPRCLFLLNYRNPILISNSIKNWNDLQKRLIVSKIPGLPKGNGIDNDLTNWIQMHFENVREHFKDNENFLELDISKDNAPFILGEKIGVKINNWGVRNKNYLYKCLYKKFKGYLKSIFN
ncbi:MAG: sulfotransferase family protein [Nanoarchaeota archaeon]